MHLQQLKYGDDVHLSVSLVIVWRLRGNIIITFYIGSILALQWAQLTETVHTARLGLEFCLFMFI